MSELLAARPAGARAREREQPRAVFTVARRLAPHALLIVAVLSAWEAASRHLHDTTIVSGPVDIAVQLWRWLLDGTLVSNTSTTLEELAIGFALGGAAAVAAAIVLSEWPPLGRFFEPYLLALSAVPNIALVPMFLVWFGIGMETKIAIGAIATFFVIFVNLYAGLRETNPHLMDLARILRATRWQRLWKIRWIAASTFLVAGIKAALPRTLIAVIVAEFLASTHGLGFIIVRAANLMNATGVFAGTLVLTGVVYALIATISFVERKMFRWKPRELR
jgi:NitT/TauT family transport system permease protein